MSDEYNVKLLVKEANLNAISINSANVNSHNKKYSGFKDLLKDNIPESLNDYNGNAYDISSVFHDTNWSSNDKTESEKSSQMFSQHEPNANLELYKNAKLVPHEDASGTTHKLWTVYDDASNNLLEHMINYKFDNSGSYLPILTYHNGSSYVESSMFSDPLWWLIDYENHAISFFNTDSVLNGGTVNISASSANPPKLTFYRYIGKTKVNNKLSVEGDISCNEVIVSGTTLTNKLGAIDLSYSDLSGIVTNNIAGIATKAPKADPIFSGNVGIGTTDPIGRFDVFQNPDEENVIIVSGKKTSGTDAESYKKGILFKYKSLSYDFPQAKIYTSHDGSSYHSNLHFQTANGDSTSVALSDAMTIDSNGKVGIGTNDPGAKLEVNGDISCNEVIVSGTTFTNKLGIIDISYVDLSGVVTTNIASIASNTTNIATNATNISGNTSSFDIRKTIVDSSFNDLSNNISELDISYVDLSGVVTANIADITSNTTGIATLNNDKAPKNSPTFTGNVGIGTTDPSGRFDVFQNPDEENVIIVSGIKGSNAELPESYKKGILFKYKHPHPYDYPQAKIYTSYGGSSYHSNLHFQTANGTSNSDTVLSDAMTIDSDGNVGIGTDSPSGLLDVSGILYTHHSSIHGSGIYMGKDIGGGSHTDYIYSYNETGNSKWKFALGTQDTSRNIVLKPGHEERFEFDASGNFTIKAKPSSGTEQITIESADYSKGILFNHAGNFDQAKIYTSGVSWDTKLHFQTANGTSNSDTVLSDAMTIDSNGNVGIGGTDPSGSKLEVFSNTSHTSGWSKNIKLSHEDGTHTGAHLIESNNLAIGYHDGNKELYFMINGEGGDFRSSQNWGQTGKMILDQNGQLGIGNNLLSYITGGNAGTVNHTNSGTVKCVGDTSSFFVNIYFPVVNATTEHTIEVTVKNLKYDGNTGHSRFYCGVQSLDANFNNVGVDQYSTYNYGVATSFEMSSVTIDSKKTFRGTFTGFNLPTSGASGNATTKFDPGAVYFRIVFFANYDTPNTNEIEITHVAYNTNRRTGRLLVNDINTEGDVIVKGHDGQSAMTLSQNLFLTTKIGELAGTSYANHSYPIVGTDYDHLYFMVGGVYVGYLTNTVVSAIDFTGQHKAKPKEDSLYQNLNQYVGRIVSSTGEISSLVNDGSDNQIIEKTGKEGISINEAIPQIELSKINNDPRCCGVITPELDENDNGEKYFTQGAFTSVIHAPEEDRRLTINQVGEGAIWVCNVNGNIQNGDFITTCDISGGGYGAKQADDLLHNYTCAKAMMDCTFLLDNPNYQCIEIEDNGTTYRAAFIACYYKF